MNDVPVTNNGTNTMYVGGYSIPPNETRFIPAHHVPAHLQPAPVAAVEPVKDTLLDLLDENVKTIMQALPDLSDEDLGRLKAAEDDGKTRKTVVNAIDGILMQRAALKTLKDDAMHMAINQVMDARNAAVDVPGELAVYDKVLKARSAEILMFRATLGAENADQLAEVDDLLKALDIPLDDGKHG